MAKMNIETSCGLFDHVELPIHRASGAFLMQWKLARMKGNQHRAGSAAQSYMRLRQAARVLSRVRHAA